MSEYEQITDAQPPGEGQTSQGRTGRIDPQRSRADTSNYPPARLFSIPMNRCDRPSNWSSTSSTNWAPSGGSTATWCGTRSAWGRECIKARGTRAGSPQGLLPGAPTDPDVHVKTHPVRHVVDSLSLTRPGRFAVTRWSRLDVLGVVPTPCPRRGAPFAPRGPGGPFPRFVTTMGRCDSLPSISPHFVSFAWRYHRFVPSFVPISLGRGLRINLELVSRCLRPAVTMETARSPKFPGNPHDHSPCSPTPV